jgi:ketosteroid isomerase-like protein
MSQENVEAFRRGIDASNRGDVEALLEELDPEIEWRSAMHALIGGEETVFRGHDGVRTLFRDVQESFSELHFEATEIQDLGDRILVIGRTRVRGKTSGAVTVTPIALVTEVRNGKARLLRTYRDPEEAREAAGLPQP